LIVQCDGTNDQGLSTSKQENKAGEAFTTSSEEGGAKDMGANKKELL